MWNLKKNDTNELICKTETDSQTQKIKGEVYGGGINQESGIDIYSLLYIIMINKALLYSTGNSTHYSVVTYTRKESAKEWIYV